HHDQQSREHGDEDQADGELPARQIGPGHVEGGGDLCPRPDSQGLDRPQHPGESLQDELQELMNGLIHGCLPWKTISKMEMRESSVTTIDRRVWFPYSMNPKKGHRFLEKIMLHE